MNQLIIATRKSPLALWQAEFVADELRRHSPTLDVVLNPMSTRGDEILDRSLARVGGKGLFLKELELAMQAGEADIAVHSMKDVPADLDDGFNIVTIMARHNPLDAFVSNNHDRLADLPQGAVVGTSSLRRQAQLLSQRPDLKVKPLRGNVNTRLAKLDSGNYDAIILAAAGLERLGLENRIRAMMPLDESLPAVAQGALGIEVATRSAKADAIAAICRPLEDADTRTCVLAERQLAYRLGGSCQVPLAAHAVLASEGRLHLSALVAEPDGSSVIASQQMGYRDHPIDLANAVAEDLCRQGAREILESVIQ